MDFTKNNSMGKRIIVVLMLCFSLLQAMAQELNCKVNVLGDQITGVDQKVFATMAQDAAAFVNTRKWSSDEFENREKIDCIFTIILTKTLEGVEGGFSGRIAIQATRPVYGTSYVTNLINYTDKDFAFKYIQFQPFDFNDNRVTGNDPLVSNLTAVMAFYANLILGFDYDSYSLRGGTEFFNKALNIVNNAPENRFIMGWKAMEGQRNRFWLSDQILNSRFSAFRDNYYKYHLQGLDLLSTEAETGRKNINAIFAPLQQINTENPSSILLAFFFAAKNEEIKNFVQQNSTAEKQRIVPILSQIDVTNAAKYGELLR
jgi:hypothetical protein